MTECALTPKLPKASPKASQAGRQQAAGTLRLTRGG